MLYVIFFLFSFGGGGGGGGGSHGYPVNFFLYAKISNQTLFVFNLNDLMYVYNCMFEEDTKINQLSQYSTS